ncbi:MAG: hypothetical protein ACM31O_21485 [Bacteroidota bacterium]
MAESYTNTISGLLRKRSELMGEAQRLREVLAVVGNDIEALDRVLETLGYKGDLKNVTPRGNRVVFFARHELRRFCLDELRKADGPITSRDLAEKIIALAGKDVRDRRLRNEMVKRVAKSLKLLRGQGIAISERNTRRIVWRLATSLTQD